MIDGPTGRPRTWGSASPAHRLGGYRLCRDSGAFLFVVFTHPRGIVDSFLAYGTYFVRGAGVNTAHVHPWYFYFVCLRGEALIAVFALLGLAAPTTPRFLKIYTVLMVLIYCAIPYKVPWNVLSFWHAAILLAGAGLVRVARLMPKPLAAALVLLGIPPSWDGKARADSFEYPPPTRAIPGSTRIPAPTSSRSSNS